MNDNEYGPKRIRLMGNGRWLSSCVVVELEGRVRQTKRLLISHALKPRGTELGRGAHFRGQASIREWLRGTALR